MAFFVFFLSFWFHLFSFTFCCCLQRFSSWGRGCEALWRICHVIFPSIVSRHASRGGELVRECSGSSEQSKKMGVFLATEIGECAYISRNMPRQHVVKTCLFLERVWFLFFRSVFFFFLTSRRNPFTSAYFAGAHRGGAAQRIRECLVLLA